MLQSPSSIGSTHGVKAEGMSVLNTVAFMVGEIAGTGVLALPDALSATGWMGVFFIVISAIGCAYTGYMLGRCRLMVLERHKDNKDNLRRPYAAIGYASYGNKLRFLISMCLNVNMSGQATVYLLLASENIKVLMADLHIHVGFCYWLVIVAIIICPFCWCGSPKDFWPIAVGASVSMISACILLLVAMARDAEEISPSHERHFNWKPFLMAFGTMFFAYGGHPMFPTFQADMRRPEKFGLVCFFVFLSLTVLYLAVSVEGFLVYKSSLQANILLTVLPGPTLTIVQVLVTVHLFCAFIIVLNPVNQEGEELFNIPTYFCFRRVLFRTSMVCLLLFLALSVPQFGAIMSLIGGSTTALLVFVFPPLCYIKLSSIHGSGETIEVPLHERLACVELIVVGILLGIGITYSALDALAYSHFTTPCYLS